MNSYRTLRANGKRKGSGRVAPYRKKRKVATSGATKTREKGQQPPGGGDRGHKPATGNGNLT